MIVAGNQWFPGLGAHESAWLLDEDGLSLRVSIADLPRGLRKVQAEALISEGALWARASKLDVERGQICLDLHPAVTLSDLYFATVVEDAQLPREMIMAVLARVAMACREPGRGGRARTAGDVAFTASGPVVVPRLTIAQAGAPTRARPPWFVATPELCGEEIHMLVVEKMADAFGLEVPAAMDLDGLSAALMIESALAEIDVDGVLRGVFPAAYAVLDDLDDELPLAPGASTVSSLIKRFSSALGDACG